MSKDLSSICLRIEISLNHARASAPIMPRIELYEGSQKLGDIEKQPDKFVWR
jgi:hypothetical protein